MSSQRKRDLEFEKAEAKYRTNLIRIIRKEFLIRPPKNPETVNIATGLKRQAVKKQLYDITAPLYNLGIKHADELIEQYRPKTTSASYLSELSAATTPLSYNELLITELTGHTIDHMVYIANDIKPDLIASLNEGYANGEGIPTLTKRVQILWQPARTSAIRFARTFTNEVYNQAHLNRYHESPVVEATQFSAHIDSRTSRQCRMLHKTIWELNDPAIQRPPLHFNCRSRLIPYFGKIPGQRDFRKAADGTEYSAKDVRIIKTQINTFRTKYWNIPISEIPKYPGLHPSLLNKYTPVTSSRNKTIMYQKYVDELAKNPEYYREVKYWQDLIDAGKTSQTLNQVNGIYTAERLKIHDDILDHFYKTTSGKQRATLFGGPAGSGKSGLMKHVKGDPNNYVYINNDEIKKLLPGYSHSNSSFFHDEAHELTNRLLAKSMSSKTNFIYDSTMGSNAKAMKLYRDLKLNGYDVSFLSTNLPLDLTLSRAVNRAIGPGQEGRYVPLELMIKNVEEINAVQFGLIDSVEHITIFDSNVAFGEDLIMIFSK